MRLSKDAYNAIKSRIKAKMKKRAEKITQNDDIAAQTGKRPYRKRSQRARLKAKLWATVSFYIRLRDKGLCRICGVHPVQVAYHLLPQITGDTLRYDESNIVGACSACNFGEHYHRLKYAAKHSQIFGDKFMASLEAKSRQITKFSDDDLIRMELEYQHKIKNAGRNA